MSEPVPARVRLYRPLLVCLLIAAMTSASAGLTPSRQSQQPQSQQPIFRTVTDAVRVDAIVLDRKGQPLTDLTADDFEIREKGKLQTITSFKLIAIDTHDQDPALRRILTMADQEQAVSREDSRLAVIFFDVYHIRRAREFNVREALATFVRNLGPRDPVAVILPWHPVAGLTFSLDHEATAREILTLNGRFGDYFPQDDDPLDRRCALASASAHELYRAQTSLGELQSVATTIGTMREGRKDIIFASEGMTGDVPSWAPRETGSPQASAQCGLPWLGQERLERLIEIIDAAKRRNVSIHTVDPRGLIDRFDDVSNGERVASTDQLYVLAHETNGHAVVNVNDLKAGVMAALRETSVYYLMSYTAPEMPRDGQYHAFSVKVKRSGVEVRAREGYWAYSEDDYTHASTPRPAAVADDVQAALATLASTSASRVIRPWLGFDRGADGKTTATLVWEAVADGSPDTVDRVEARVSGEAGAVVFRGPIAKETQRRMPGGHATFAVKPGSLRLHLVALSPDGSALDTDDREVVVPDFSASGVFISTPQVFHVSIGRDAQLIGRPSGPLPAADAEFSRSEHLVMRVHAYGPAGSEPAMVMRVLDRNGQPTPLTLSPLKQDDGSQQIDVIAGSLAAGEYLIEIDASSPNGRARSVVAFRVK